MATDTTQLDTTNSEQQSVASASPLGKSDQPSVTAKPTSPEGPLPPRVDSGAGVDQVLGEVNKLFGQESDRSVPVSTTVADEFDDHMNALKGSDAPVAHPAASAEPSKEMRLGTAADLFRSVPDEQTNSNPSTSGRESPAAENEQSIDSLDRSTSAAGHSPATSFAAKIASRLPMHLPKRAKISIALAAAAVMGWIAGAALSGSRASQSVETSASAERSEESSAHPTDESAAKTAALEEQLQKAITERETAQRERAQAVVRLKQAESKLDAGKHATQEGVGRELAARRKAEENFRKAEEQVRLLQRKTYNVQLARVRDAWRRNPGLAQVLLQDAERCPPQLRDFTWGYFYGRAKNDRATFAGHAGPVNAVGWSPDGKWIASGGQDGLIKFRDAASGQEVASLLAHAGGVMAVAFSRRGELLASGGADGTVKLWDVASRKLFATYFGHMGAVRAVAISPDASGLVSGSDDGTVKFWDVVLRRPTATRWGHPRSSEAENANDLNGCVRSIAYSPDGRYVASGGYRVIRIWNADNALEKTSLAVAEGAITALAFSPRGTTLSAGTDGAIYHWEVNSFVSRLEPATIDGPVFDLKYSNDGRLLAAATETCVVILHEPIDVARPVRNPLEPSADVERFRFQSTAPVSLRGHAGAVTGVAFSPDAQSLVTSGVDGTVRLWDPENRIADKVEPDVVWRDRSRMVAVAYAPNGGCFAAAGSNSIHLWSMPENVEVATLDNHSGQITTIAFSPDGKYLASAGRDWPILIWDLAAQRVKTALNGHTAAVNSVAYAPDGSKLLSAGDDGTIRVWDVAAGRQTALLSGHVAPVLDVIISSDGKLAASSSADHSVRLWDLVQNRPLATLSGHTSPVVALSFSPDGRFLVSAERPARNFASPVSSTDKGNANPPINLWSLPQGELVHRFGTRKSAVARLVFSPDGRTLAASGVDGTTLWDAETCEVRETLHFRDAGPIGPLAFSPNGTTLAAAGEHAIVFWTASPFASKHAAE